ncbi:Uncharacterized conserved protein [Paracoccus halophilus]|uniref:Uncharacterized conserved protein n=1 Tax=Paracoccus halophilus TaxID=376733 RepID=A0A099EZL0_9RHOB|nr:DUF2303 family protein [Paracoccus halophilus]KGJ03649.1 hypothetical protein IT41_13635 [Paracoccus halophilus]SFA57923.1 Uncharacterized conserved protein [Paracoccus halophilus]
MESTEQKNIAETIIETMKELGDIQTIAAPDVGDELTVPTMVAVPNGLNVQDVTNAHLAALTRLKPLRRTGTAHLADLSSFIGWINRFKGEQSVIFSQINPAPKLTAVIDYHGQGAPTLDAGTRDVLANACKHRAEYNFPLSREWRLWQSIHDKPLTKDEFGEFIEANAKDLLDPTPFLLGRGKGEPEPWEQRMADIAAKVQGRFGQYSALVQLSRSFQIHETGHLNVTTNRDTGEAQVQFLTEHKELDGAPLRIPNLFMIAIPVFDEGALYRLAVRFRYRKAGDSVKFIVSLYNADVALRDATREAIEAAEAATELPVLMGTPEA